MESLSYSYDALNRQVSRNTDTFGYNDRSEVTAAMIGGIASSYGYDEIGNSTFFTPNNINQYTGFSYDLDGNLLTNGTRTFTYDAANRLKTVLVDGVLALTNFYDAKSRRVRKSTPDATTTFFYDDWNLAEERVAYANGTSSTIRYHWGKDLSGMLQGAGNAPVAVGDQVGRMSEANKPRSGRKSPRVGGLLYLTVDDAVYVPCYDNNGNITRYLDSSGNTVAQYTYDAFGNTISQSGPLAGFFRHRFSTKYFDPEIGLYYYGYRFYHPVLMRWLTRDPIEEDGGVNLYGFCKNSTLVSIDYLGQNIYLYTGNNTGNWLNDHLHQAVVVDEWTPKGKRAKKIGKVGFSFGYNGDWGWRAPSFSWLGFDGFTVPGYWMEGEIYDIDNPPGEIVAEKKTTCAQDRAWLKKMRGRVGTTDVYSVGRHNCRNFSQSEFNKAPGVRIK